MIWPASNNLLKFHYNFLAAVKSTAMASWLQRVILKTNSALLLQNC